MKSFQCQNCGQLLFFENTQCLQCGYRIGYLPEAEQLSALEPAGGQTWRPLAAGVSPQWRLCQNYRQAQACNWLVPADSGESFCRACRLNSTIPNLSEDNHRELWRRLEEAKRRLVYSLLALGLPVISKAENPERGLAFDFLAADAQYGEPVQTGHADGLITINIAEADSVAREQARVSMNEPYRTLLGHFRHESGHYYWMYLIQNSHWLEPFRALFGDERRDYQMALNAYYTNGAPADWQQRFVSAYASMHPWEDWAETWAHYLHITDAIETAQEFGVHVEAEQQEAAAASGIRIRDLHTQPFEQIVEHWLPLTYAINSINRSLGQPDMYPFVLSTGAIEKLSFIHRVINE